MINNDLKRAATLVTVTSALDGRKISPEEAACILRIPNGRRIPVPSPFVETER